MRLAGAWLRRTSGYWRDSGLVLMVTNWPVLGSNIVISAPRLKERACAASETYCQ